MDRKLDAPLCDVYETIDRKGGNVTQHFLGYFIVDVVNNAIQFSEKSVREGWGPVKNTAWDGMILA